MARVMVRVRVEGVNENDIELWGSICHLNCWGSICHLNS